MPTPTDTRNERQKRVYRWRVNLYQPVAMSVGTSQRLTDQPKYPDEPTYSAVWAFLIDKDNRDTPTTAGRNLSTNDTFKFVAEQEIGDSWLIEIVSGPSAVGGVWVALSAGQERPSIGESRRANQLVVPARKIPRPSYLPAFEPLVS